MTHQADFNAIPADQYPAHRGQLVSAYRAVRRHSRQLTCGFSEAEHQLQSMPDASPVKWHLAHTTWFFETFILQSHKPNFDWFNPQFCYLFNSYYNAIGAQYPRPKRGLISSPNLQEVWEYRARIDGDITRLLEQCDEATFAELAPTLVLGLNHEQQHQELICTDVKHGLFQAAGVEAEGATPGETPLAEPGWQEHPGGRTTIGHEGSGFCFDNEQAAHEVLLTPFRLATQLVTCGEWLEFMEDGGYEQPLLWLSDGWQWRNENKIEAPLYWRKINGKWHQFSAWDLSRGDGKGVGAAPRRDTGWHAIKPFDPVLHISYYEADAFAEWRGARLPRETEWEAVMKQKEGALQTSQAWEWTQSAYAAYPGFKPSPGMAGEYNGKFMINQMVLRGASPVTSPHHSRPSYRNFFHPGARWQYSSLRLAKDV